MKKANIPYIVVIVLGAVFMALALTITPLSQLKIHSDGAFPIFIAFLSIVFGVWVFADENKKRKKGTAEDPGHVIIRDVLVIIALLAVYAVAMYFLGYIISTLIFTTAAISYLHGHNIKMGLLVGFISTFLIVLVFKYGFNVILP